MNWDEFVQQQSSNGIWRSLGEYFVWYDPDFIRGIDIIKVPNFNWPTWSVRARPYDWTYDGC